MLFRIQLILMTLGHNFCFSIFKSREIAKDDSSLLQFLISLKGQVLKWTFSFRESKRNESDYSGKSRQMDYQTNHKTTIYTLVIN